MEHCKVIAITNQKGGVGKTTTTVNLGVGLVRQGRRVLLLDADPQGSLSISLGIKQPDDLSESLATIMQKVIEDESVPMDTAVHHHAEGVDFIPANIELSGIDVSLVNTMSREHVLKTHVNELRKCYDYAVRSINSMLASLNSLLTFLGWAECKVKSITQQKQVYCAEEKELTKAEYMRLLDAAKNNRQLQLVMEAICSTGIRVSELRFFTVEAVQQGEVVVNCKGKTRTILIPGKLRKLLLDYAKKEKIRSGVIFITRNGRPLNRSCIWAQMKALCVEAGVNPSKVFPHNLRKLFARTFYGIEKDIAKLADILGHSSIDTTRIYIMTTGTEHRKKIERLGLVV